MPESDGYVDSLRGVPHVGVGLVGAGGIARLHAVAYSLIPGYFAPPAAVPVKRVIADVSVERARSGAERLGFAEYVTDVDALLERDDIDVVDITTPNSAHAEVAIAAARHGKMIICEKPLSVDLASTRAMHDAAVKANVRTAVNFHKRRHPAILHVKNLVEGGRLGDLLFIHGTYRQSFAMQITSLPPGTTWRQSRAAMGSFFAESGSHLIDLARHLAGEFTAVSGTDDLHNGATGRDIDLLTVFAAKFANGALGTFEVAQRASGEGDGLAFELYGTKGAVRWSAADPVTVYFSREEVDPADRGFTAVRMGAPHPNGDQFGGMSQDGLIDAKTIEVHDILRAFVTGQPYSPDFGDGLRAAEVADAVSRSIESGQWTAMPPEP